MFIVIKKSKLILTILLVAVICVATSLCFNAKVTEAFSTGKKLPIYSVECAEKKVALTFDAAWGADKTSGIMDILEKYNMNGTFFLVGFWIDKYPEKAKEIFDRGFLLGNHSTNHLHMSKLSAQDVAKEISITSKKLEEITSKKTTYFRAPFGEYNNTILSYIENQNMYCAQWDVDSLDWKGLTGAQIAERILSKVREGSIILCHNNSDYILEALPLVLLGLKNKGYVSVRLDELILQKDYYIDNNGRQHTKK